MSDGSPKAVYVVDTSALVDWHDRYYPIDCLGAKIDRRVELHYFRQAEARASDEWHESGSRAEMRYVRAQTGEPRGAEN